MVTAFGIFALAAFFAACLVWLIGAAIIEAANEARERARLYDEKRARRARYERLAGLNR